MHTHTHTHSLGYRHTDWLTEPEVKKQKMHQQEECNYCQQCGDSGDGEPAFPWHWLMNNVELCNRQTLVKQPFLISGWWMTQKSLLWDRNSLHQALQLDTFSIKHRCLIFTVITVERRRMKVVFICWFLRLCPKSKVYSIQSGERFSCIYIYM